MKFLIGTCTPKSSGQWTWGMNDSKKGDKLQWRWDKEQTWPQWGSHWWGTNPTKLSCVQKHTCQQDENLFRTVFQIRASSQSKNPRKLAPVPGEGLHHFKTSECSSAVLGLDSTVLIVCLLYLNQSCKVLWHVQVCLVGSWGKEFTSHNLRRRTTITKDGGMEEKLWGYMFWEQLNREAWIFLSLGLCEVSGFVAL